jgi:hypothetical protein
METEVQIPYYGLLLGRTQSLHPIYWTAEEGVRVREILERLLRAGQPQPLGVAFMIGRAFYSLNSPLPMRAS